MCALGDRVRDGGRRPVRGRTEDDERQLRNWVRTHSTSVRSLIGRYEYNSEDIDEVTSDVFGLAYRSIDTLRGTSDAQMRGWLLQTARHLVANHVRRAISRRRLIERLARQPAALDDGPPEALEDREAELLARLRDQRVRQVLDRMREDYRLVLVMNALGDPDRTIAQALGVTPNAARKRLMRARMAFRAEYVEAAMVVDFREEPSHD